MAAVALVVATGCAADPVPATEPAQRADAAIEAPQAEVAEEQSPEVIASVEESTAEVTEEQSPEVVTPVEAAPTLYSDPDDPYGHTDEEDSFVLAQDAVGSTARNHFSDGELVEGGHYLCMIYNGTLPEINVMEQIIGGYVRGEDSLPPVTSPYFPATDEEIGMWIGSVTNAAVIYLCPEHEADYRAEQAALQAK